MSDITREEAIKILKDTLYDERTPNNYIQAVRMGREALENQTSVIAELDKIKTRIDEEVVYVNKWQVKNDSIKIIDERISELKGETE